MKFTSILAASLGPVAAFAAAVPQMTGPGPVQTFDQFLASAVQKVKATYPKAQLQLVRGLPFDGAADAHGMADVQRLTVTMTTGAGNSCTVETVGNDVGEVKAAGQVLVGARAFDWPQGLKLSGLDADQVLKSSGHDEGYTEVEISYPLTGEPAGQPSYYFTMDDGSRVVVGATDGKIQGDKKQAQH